MAWSVAIGAAGLVGFSAYRPREAGGRWLVEVGAVLLLFALLAAYQFRVALLQAQLRAGAVVRVGIAQAVMSIVVPLGLLKTIGGGYTAILCGSAISYGLALWFSRAGEGPGGPGTGQEPAGPSTMNVLRILWSYGWALSLWYTATSAMPVADRFLIERAHGFAATGRYAALYDLLRAHGITRSRHFTESPGVSPALLPTTLKPTHTSLFWLWLSMSLGPAVSPRLMAQLRR